MFREIRQRKSVVLVPQFYGNEFIISLQLVYDFRGFINTFCTTAVAPFHQLVKDEHYVIP